MSAARRVGELNSGWRVRTGVSGLGVTVTNWIFEENLQSFILAIAQFAGYPLEEDEWLAIRTGVEGTDAEAGQWFDYEFLGRHGLRFWLARDPGTSVVHARIEASPNVAPKVEAALEIFQWFHVRTEG